MERHELEAVFDQKCASGYDRQWAKLSPLRDTMYLFINAILADLGEDARILCVGAGTGSELVALAEAHPRWTFTAVEPSAPMLEVCRRKAEASNLASRCEFHAGYLESLPVGEVFDAATSLLVSQFILDGADRAAYFREIAGRLRPGGWLINTDLAADTTNATYPRLLETWWRVMRASDAPPEGLAKMRAAYERDVAILPPEEVAGIIASSGFDTPVPILQTGLIHGWFARRR